MMCNGGTENQHEDVIHDDGAQCEYSEEISLDDDDLDLSGGLSTVEDSSL